jgi:opacity protein-like surface antigen
MSIKSKFLFSLLLWAVLVAQAAAATEAQKIQQLIQSVEQLSNAKFIRNGVEYDANAAGEHLRMKLRMAGGNVKTADDFIRLCASKSSVSGRAYQIRFSDGKVVTSETFLRQKLKELSRRG